jgi:hypothetical protein
VGAVLWDTDDNWRVLSIGRAQDSSDSDRMVVWQCDTVHGWGRDQDATPSHPAEVVDGLLRHSVSTLVEGENAMTMSADLSS